METVEGEKEPCLLTLLRHFGCGFFFSQPPAVEWSRQLFTRSLVHSKAQYSALGSHSLSLELFPMKSNVVPHKDAFPSISYSPLQFSKNSLVQSHTIF